jgi:ABC-type transport system involved in multi-copper enzyme maturation permease subunit
VWAVDESVDLVRLNFQPIVERELRVAARRRSTYWTRGLAALLASGFAIWILGITISAGGPVRGGRMIFTGLSACALVACLFAGVFLTADSLSYEKREGTLGLLFLTDLRGSDIVLGKLTATSVAALYGLLAIVPVLAIPILLGGVTWWEFARVVTGLVGTLLFSLSLGMMFSSVCRQEHASMAATGFTVVVWTVLGLAAGPQALSPLGPYLLAFEGAYLTSPAAYFSAVLMVSLLAGVFLFAAARILPGAWEDQPVKNPSTIGSPNAEPNPLKSGHGETPPMELPIANAQATAARRAETLERNPVEWLVSRHVTPAVAWLLTGLGGCLLAMLLAGRSGLGAAIPFLVFGIHGTLKLCVAWDASRLLAEHRRTGGLELILVTDLGVNDFLEGCRAALSRRFRGVTKVVIGIDVAGGAMLFVAAFTSGGRGGWGDPMTGIVVSVAVLVGMLLLDLWALSWVGLWLGIRHRWPWQAACWSVARVMVLPWGIAFAGLLLGGAAARGAFGWPVALVMLWILLGLALSYAF